MFADQFKAWIRTRGAAGRRRRRDQFRIRYDYSTTMDEGSFTMRCRCGAPGCRQVVRDFSELPAGIQEYYLSQGLVMNFMARWDLAREAR